MAYHISYIPTTEADNRKEKNIIGTSDILVDLDPLGAWAIRMVPRSDNSLTELDFN